MSVTLTLAFDNIQQLNEFLRKNEGSAKQPAEPARQPDKPAPKPAAAPAAAKPNGAASPLDYERDVKPAALEVNKRGRELLIATLKPFGVARAPDLKPEQYAEFIAACNAAVKG